jgi:hypothetical protein
VYPAKYVVVNQEGAVILPVNLIIMFSCIPHVAFPPIVKELDVNVP